MDFLKGALLQKLNKLILFNVYLNRVDCIIIQNMQEGNKSSTKMPTLEQLIKIQKQLNAKLCPPKNIGSKPSSKQSKLKQAQHSSKIKQKLEAVSTENSYNWEEIDLMLASANETVNQLKNSQPLYYNSNFQHRLGLLRNQVSRNQLLKSKLQIQKCKLERQSKFEHDRLQLMLQKLDQLELTIKHKQYQQNLPIGETESMLNAEKYPSLQKLIDYCPGQQKQQYLKIINQSPEQSRAIDFFNFLSSNAMRTDRYILFLQKKNLEEEQKLEDLENQLKKFTKTEQQSERSLTEWRKQMQKQQKQKQRVQQQLKYIKRPTYINQEVEERANRERLFQEQECSKLKNTILKLYKLIQVSSDSTSIAQANTIMREYRVI